MSKQASDTSSTNSSTAGEGADTPASNPSSSLSHTPPAGPVSSLRSGSQSQQQNMDKSTTTKDPAPAADRDDKAQPADSKPEAADTTDAAAKLASPTKKTKCKNPEHKKQKKQRKASTSKKAGKSDSGSDSDSSDGGSSDSSSSSEEETSKKKASKSKKSKKAKAKAGKKGKKEVDSDGSDSDSDDSSSDDSDAELKAKLKKLKKAKKGKGKKLSKAKKAAAADSEEDESGEDETELSTQPDFDAELRAIESKIAALRLQQNAGRMALPKLSRAGRGRHSSFSGLSGLSGLGRRGNLKLGKVKTPKIAELEDDDEESKYYKRVDQLWDTTIHNYKLKESAEEDESEFSEYAFLVRRTFNWENKYEETLVDIKSKQLRAALQEVMKGCKSVSLEAKEPSIDPNLLFLYLDELRAYYKTALKAKIKAAEKRKAIKKLQEQRAQVKALVGYIDEDYADTKKTLYPLLKAGNITFDLMWALFKPNDIAVSSCYGNWDEPRCFKVDYANLCSSMMRGKWWCIEGSYLEYDGKAFGFGDYEVDIEAFKGPRKISSLATYPLRYHREEAKVRKQIVERGERFVGMAGMHYRFHKGLAFMKKKKQVLKININGRIMVDPATFRRVNPNYPISYIKAKEADDLFSFSDDEDEDEDGCCSCGGGSDDEDDFSQGKDSLEKKFDVDRPRYKYKWDTNERGDTVFMAVEVDADGDPVVRNRAVEKLATEDVATKGQTFTEEELLLTSPVMLGFAFSEKLWLEFTISGINDIQWNDNAFDSLVLPPNQKSIVRALVESHKFSAHKAIDDVVQGKGKGLVSVLHGPPGTGKTLTAEGISEMLRCPLYMVSAGELGTDPARLEHELQKILDIAHSWGAILLLDEADVFLEKREVHDIHRNALVSIFLRLLEYFQGILFLTTNRVETFDDAFQSRIHVALRYGELTHRAKKTVWGMFLDMVRKEMAVADFSDGQLEVLARHELNGRQIKNLVRSAQALALHEKVPMGVEHVKRVVEVADTFSKDLRGGTGYIDAMRSYT